MLESKLAKDVSLRIPSPDANTIEPTYEYREANAGHGAALYEERLMKPALMLREKQKATHL